MEFHIMSVLNNQWESCAYYNTMTDALEQLDVFIELDKNDKEHKEYFIEVVDNDRREEYIIYSIELLTPSKK